MRLYQAVIEWFEAMAEQHRENVAQRWLQCGCGCGALNALTDDD